MTLSQKKYYNPTFSHIYCEKNCFEKKETQFILSKLKNSKIIIIEHYKDIFCRKRQNPFVQKNSQNLIIAENKGNLFYKGAPVCQNFGNNSFFYTTNVINCLYDCEYCFLQGMYPSSNIVVFINFDDYIKSLSNMLENNNIYLCVSFDTDLLAMENLFGFCKKWVEFASNNKSLTIEIRTKSDNFKSILNITPTDNVILAWSLSPNQFWQNYEHKTPDIKKRLNAAKEAIDFGWKVRFCLDPLIYSKQYKYYYNDLIQIIFKNIPTENINDISIGAFRMSSDYLKKIRQNRKDSLIINYPFEISNGIYHYNQQIENTITSFVFDEIKKYMDESKIFIWKENE